MKREKNIIANQLNVRRSSGPKTATGKNNSSRNATKAIDNPGVDEISSKELFRRLRHQEEQLSEDAFKWLQTQFANQRFFSHPLFDPPCDVSDESRESLSDPGVKYDFLLLLLRNCRTREERLFILATWLHREGICQPEDLLGKDFSRYRRKALRGSRGRLSITDLRQAFIVNNWEPYFEQLLLAQRKGLDLWRLGFDERAIQSASRRKRSAIAAACDYVSSHLQVDPPALANAYSRVFSSVKKRNSGLPMHDHRPVS
jgi:hypothetical protein